LCDAVKHLEYDETYVSCFLTEFNFVSKKHAFSTADTLSWEHDMAVSAGSSQYFTEKNNNDEYIHFR